MTTLRDPNLFFNELEFQKLNNEPKFAVYGYIKINNSYNISILC